MTPAISLYRKDSLHHSETDGVIQGTRRNTCLFLKKKKKNRNTDLKGMIVEQRITGKKQDRKRVVEAGSVIS